MTENNVENTIMEICEKHLNIPKSSIKPNSSFVNDLGADSIDCVEIIMAIEDKYNISIPDEELENLTTFEKLCKRVEEKILNNKG